MPRRARVSRTTWANSARSRKLLSPRGLAGEAGEGVSAAAMVLVDAGAGDWFGDSKGAKAARNNFLVCLDTLEMLEKG